MKKTLSILFIILFTLLTNDTFGQCFWQDTSIIYRVKTIQPYGIAISNGGVVAVSSVNRDSTSDKMMVKVWYSVDDFTDGLKANDSIKLTSPEAVAFDNSGYLYVAQTERADSNLLILDASLNIVKSIDNSIGTPFAWSKPRGIALDSIQNLYIISDDSTDAGGLAIPNTGKLIKITAPMSTATKSLLIDHLNAPKAVAIKDDKIYIAEFGANELSKYAMVSLNKVDSIYVGHPMDLTVKQCKIYCTEHTNNTVKIFNSENFADTLTADTLVNTTSNHGKYGTTLDADADLYVCRNDSNKVAFYMGVVPGPVPDTIVGGVGMPGRRFCFHTYASYPAVGIWTSADTSIITIDSLTGVAYGVNGGYTYVYQRIDTNIYTYFAWVETPIIPGPVYAYTDTGIATDSTRMCYLNTLRVHNGSHYGSWTSSDNSLAVVSRTGKVWPKSPGVVHISFNRTNTCGSASSSLQIKIEVMPKNSPIIGDTLVCHDAVFTLIDTSTGGKWKSSNDTLASVDSVTGVVTPLHAGHVDISYIVENSCDLLEQKKTITIDSTPVAGSIYAVDNIDSICKTRTVQYRDTTGTLGGKWHSSDSTIASVNATGVITGINEGTTIISYTVMNICDTLTATKTVRVLPDAHSGAVTGPTTICPSVVTTLTEATSTGNISWISTDATIATVIGSGTIMGLPGSTTRSTSILHIATNSCNADTTYFTIVVPYTVHGGTISGSSNVCVSSTTPLTVTGGTTPASWVSRNPTIAGINAAGVVNGIAAGTASIMHIATNVCGADTTYFSITVIAHPVAGAISGPAINCIGSAGTLGISTSTGTTAWSSSDPGIVSVDGSGNFYCGTDGTATITFTATTGCGIATSTYSFTVEPNAYTGPVFGVSSTCQGNTEYFYTPYSVGAGYWISDDVSIADVDAYGTVTAIGPGTTNIHYSTSTLCSADDGFTTITVNPLPVAGGISGADSVCYGATISMTSYGASDPGTWTSSNIGIASVSASGTVIGTSVIAATTTISYTVSNSCGNDVVTHNVNVKNSPLTGVISGPTTVCVGSVITLGGVLPGGFWHTSTPYIANVLSSTGTGTGISGISTGLSTISYTVNTFSCGSASVSSPVNVLPLPNPGYITGADSLCQNSFDTLRNHAATPGGTWTSRLGKVLFMSATSGIDTIMFKGIIAGADTIVYTVSTSCGIDSAVFRVTINSLPSDGTVTGPTEVCVGSSITLADATGTPGGTWGTSDPSVASVNTTTGVVTGTGGGPVVITYSGSTACGSIPDPYTITVNPIAVAYISSAISSVCTGSTVTLDNTGSYGTGTWSSNNTTIATIDATTGEMGGVSWGTTTITYSTATPSCGSDMAVMSVTVNPLPYGGVITGPDSVCYGSTISLTDITPSGVWSSAATSIATVTSTGIVSGASAGLATTTISYTVTSGTCGSAASTHPITVKPLPIAGTITGSSTVCTGTDITLSSIIPGGVWSSPSPLVSINASTGVLHGISVGVATISYAVTNTCGTAYATTTISITGVPVMSPITGLDSVCVGAAIVETSTPSGGTWSTRYGLLSVTSTMPTTATLTGISAGVDTVTYTAINTCGSSSVSKTVLVKALPITGYISGADSVCPGNVQTLTDPTAASGGVWSHTGTYISLTSAGVATALSAGTETISYTLTNSCGSAAATHSITVNPLPVAGTITGGPGVCVGASITLSNTTGTPGGVWSCGSGGTITPTGLFTGVTPGVVSVSYAASTHCGTQYAYYSVTVNPLPYVPAVIGAGAVCVGATITLSDSVSGGFWSISPSTVATINSLTGILGGVVTGTATVTYSVGNLCGNTNILHTVTVQSTPTVASIIGLATVCPAASTTLYDATPGGIWSMSNTHASVNTTGMITGITSGSDTAYYTVTNSCGTVQASRVVTIEAIPGTDTISGPIVACIGVGITLSSPVSGGVWSATNGNATVTASGVVTGVTTGIDTIHYAVSNTCGSATSTKIMTVQSSVVPSVTATVSPSDTVCSLVVPVFTATVINGGSTPFVQWKKSGVNIGTGLSIPYSPTNGDIIYCVLASNAVCPTLDTVYSNNITMTVIPSVTPIISVTASPSDTVTYIGQPFTFTATLTNCGSSPVYQWYLNGTAIAGETSSTYTLNASGNDAVYCIATCDIVCATAIYNHSNTITLNTSRVGINNVHNLGNAFSLYPNPNTGTFTLGGIINTGNNEAITYEVIDVMGRVLYKAASLPINGVIHEQITLRENTVPGQYMLRLIANNGAEVIHFMIYK